MILNKVERSARDCLAHERNLLTKVRYLSGRPGSLDGSDAESAQSGQIAPPFAIAASAFRRKPVTLARLIALRRNRVENSSCDIAVNSLSFGATIPPRGVKRSSSVCFEKRDHGQTS